MTIFTIIRFVLAFIRALCLLFYKPRTSQQRRNLSVERGIVLARRRRIGYYNGLTSRHARKLGGNRRAQSALYLVAHYGFAHFVGYRKTHPHTSCGRVNQNNVVGRNAHALAVYVRKRTVLIQSVRLIEQLLAERRGGKAFAPLVATTLEHAATALSFHSLTKAVHLALLTFFGLISSFHGKLRIRGHTPP